MLAHGQEVPVPHWRVPPRGQISVVVSTRASLEEPSLHWASPAIHWLLEEPRRASRLDAGVSPRVHVGISFRSNGERNLLGNPQSG